MPDDAELEKEFASFRRRLAGMTPQEYADPAVQAELRRLNALRKAADQFPATIEKSTDSAPVIEIFTLPLPATRNSLRNNRFLLPCAALALGLCVTLVYLLSGVGKDAPVTPVATNGSVTGSTATMELPAATKEETGQRALVTLEELVAKEPEYRFNPQRVSEVFADFSRWDDQTKLNYVSDVMSVQVLPPDVLALFKQGIQSRENSHLLRNNMANALMSQAAVDFELEDVFWRMFNDSRESATWRDYSLQFYAGCARFSPKPEVIANNLATLATSEEPDLNSGTAAIMLSYEAGSGTLRMPADFNDRLARSMLSSPERNLQAAAISVFARTGDRTKLPLIRQKAGSDDAFVRRVALAALGDLGGKEDRELVSGGLADSDRLVVQAAQAALKKLNLK